MIPSVLVCDDSNLARKQVIRSLPENWKNNIQTATNGAEGLAVLRAGNIDIMFLDLTMPVVDGLGVLQSINDEGLSVSVFVVSADIQPEMQSRVLGLGARAFMKKPIDPNHLQQVLAENELI